MKDDPKLLVHEVATLLGISEEMVRHYIRTESLPAERFGRVRYVWLVRKSDAEKFIKPGVGRPKSIQS